MGMFDIDSKFDEKEKYTINLLCEEIRNEYHDASSSAPYNLGDSLFNKFKSPDNSGLINKLRKHLKFDIEKIVVAIKNAGIEQTGFRRQRRRGEGRTGVFQNGNRVFRGVYRDEIVEAASVNRTGGQRRRAHRPQRIGALRT